MNKIVTVFTAGLLLAALCACGKAPSAPSANTSGEEISQAQTESNDFRYAKKELPKGWTVQEDYGTSSYLEAVYGKGEDAPVLTVSVFNYDDQYGFSKANALAEAVHAREKKSSEIQTRTINGTVFYYLSFPSPENEKLLRYEFYGQTEPDSENRYKFYMIVLDKLTDAKQYETLQEALDCIDFSEK